MLEDATRALGSLIVRYDAKRKYDNLTDI
jgi:hypothetical protein